MNVEFAESRLLGMEISPDRFGSAHGDPLTALPAWGLFFETPEVAYHLLPPITYEVHYQVPVAVFIHTFNQASGRSSMGHGPLQPWNAEPGGSCLVPPQVAMRLVQHTPLEFLALGISVDRVRRVSPAVAAIQDHVPTSDLGLAALAMELRRCMLAEPVGSGPYLDSLTDAVLQRFAIAVERANPPSTAAETLSRHLARQVSERIDAGLARKIRVAELADSVGLSRSHFTRAFTQHFGMSPQHYILARRITRARTLLADSDTAVSDVAMACGFANPSHLSKAFKRALGLTPTAYRRALTRGAPRDRTSSR